jgi:hypothetical protein
MTICISVKHIVIASEIKLSFRHNFIATEMHFFESTSVERITIYFFSSLSQVFDLTSSMYSNRKKFLMKTVVSFKADAKDTSV